MRAEEFVVSAWARRITKQLLYRAMRDLQKMDGECLLGGDDCCLKNTWEEICAQMQDELWFSWDAHLMTIEAILGGMVESLSHEEQLALWLQTEQGWDWVYDHCEDNDGDAEAPVYQDDIVAYLKRLLLDKACDYSNCRIRRVLETTARVLAGE